MLAFPCNQFGDQEPGDMDSVLEHVSTLYDVEFPIFNKISVFGEYADPAFKFLTGMYFWNTIFIIFLDSI